MASSETNEQAPVDFVALAQSSGEAILKFFAYAHLPPHLQAVSKPIGELARQMVETLPRGAERAAGLRKLLEAKDCLVRAALDKPAPVREAPPVRVP